MPRIILYIVLILISTGLLYFSYQNDLSKYYSKLSKELSEENFKKANSREVFINFPNKSQKYSLSEIGVGYSKTKELIIDENKFNQFKIKMEEELNYLAKNPIISLERQEFYMLGDNSKITLDTNHFLSEVTLDKLLSNNQIRIAPKFKESFIRSENVSGNQKLIKKISNSPLQIKIGRQVINLNSSNLESFTSSYNDENKKQIIKLDSNNIEMFLESLRTKYKLPADFNTKEAGQKLATHLLFRLTEEVYAKALVLPITSTYTLKPDLHQKFIEVNKSNQRAYLFENGKLFKEYVISTGITWETPAGSFRVLNKVPMTISYSRIWYMPWYLPIGTINGPYYFGFHEVPYQVSYNGMIYSRDPETIGSPATGGCIQVLKGQAKEIYDWADVGMPVYITENK